MFAASGLHAVARRAGGVNNVDLFLGQWCRVINILLARVTLFGIQRMLFFYSAY